jgi:excisionase family DNA binding protein
MTRGRWMTTGMAADYLGVSTATIRRMVARGHLTARHYPGSWYQVETASVERASRVTHVQRLPHSGLSDDANGE